MKNTNRALLSSVVALILCCSMLVGTTFAWFTDEVTSGVNTIQAGKLDVDALVGGKSIEGIDTLFNDVELWEPGAVAYENVTIVNKGNLDLKYSLMIGFDNENTVTLEDGSVVGLSDILKVAVVKGGINVADRNELLTSNITWTDMKDWAVESIALEANKEEVYGIAICWQPTANDNNWNVQESETSDKKALHIDLGIKVFATQLASESDSFDNQYDALAPYPVAKVNPWPTTVEAMVGLGGSTSKVINLDVAYQFLATETAAQGAASPYANWHADFVVSVDRDIPDGHAGLAGYYSAWCDTLADGKWVALESGITANTEVRLVRGMAGEAIWVDYKSICEYSFADGNTYDGFLCGAYGDEYLDGVTLTVELRLYETYTKEECIEKFGVNSANYEKQDHEPDAISGEKKYYVTLGTFTHTFTAGDCVSTAGGLQEAIKGDVSYVTLTDDITLENGSFEIGAGDEMVIDLNGHAMTVTNTEAKASCAIKNSGKLTIKNGTVTYKGVGDTSFGYGTNTISNSGELVIDGAAIVNTTPEGSSVAIDCSAGAKLTINSGLIKSEKNAIRLCPFGAAPISCTINGGEISGARAIQIQLPSNNPADAPDIDLTITGGTFTSTTGLALYSYSAGQSFANVDVAISGGTFNGDVCFGGGNAKTTVENVTVTGGTFNGELGRYLANDGWEDIAKP